MELYNLTISQALKAILKGEISPLELTNAIFTRIEAVEDKVRAYVTLTKDDALRKARQAQNRIKKALHTTSTITH
ncbi:MAG: amidase family protein, partial [Candidatus Mariimomonas ferrooxydans]